MNLVDRVKNILATPRTEWQVIETEPGDAAYLFTNYVAILAAIPAVCGFIGTALVGYGPFRVGIGTALVSAIFGYILSFVVVYIVALIADALAPNFGGRKDFPSALKLTVYSYTPAWLVGIFSLIPALSILGVLGLYAFYLFYLGATPLMKVPAERSVIYTVAVVICGVVLSIVIGAIPALLLFR
jgi:Yip1 domain